MGTGRQFWATWAFAILLFGYSVSHAAATRSKTIRVEHGRPVVVVSDQSVLVLEFVKEPIGEALIPHPGNDIRHCRAKYRFQLYDGRTGAITNGSGLVEEVFERLDATNVKDVGSKVGIPAGHFYLWWSEAGAGARSWVYYRSDSPVRFIQQPREVSYDGIGPEQLARYLRARNVQEYSAAGRNVHVTGPAVFEGDLPTEAGASGRIESATVRDGEFALKLTELATNKHYIIESSYQVGSGNWAPVHTFLPHKPDYAWSEPLSKGADTVFYRIRVAAY
jgi:hypothetical protein